MKITLYILALAALFSACSASQSFTRAEEDDIYYVPGKRSLFVEEVKKQTGVDIATERTSSSRDNAINDKTYPKENDTSVNARSHAIGMARYATEKQVQKTEERTGQPVARIEIPEGDGYWLGGFRGTDNDLEECVRIMNRYPEGFAYFGNGYEIAQNLSFSTDWNVFTLNGRYWWFPSNSNFALYNELIFGNYPKYIWTTIWNDPHFDSYAWSNCAAFGWDHRGWRSSFGWGASWGCDPFRGGYYGYNPWGYDPWGSYYGYYPRWDYPYWGYRPGWGHHGPNWGYHRPGGGGGAIDRPTTPTTRYAPKKQYTTNRNARSYSTYSRSSGDSGRSSSNYNRQDSGSSNYNRGSYSRGNSGGGSYGSSSTSRSSSGSSGPVERTNTGSRR